MAHDVFVFPTSFAQRRLWFIEQLTGSRPVYNVATTIELDWPVPPADFARALEIAIDRHEVLRTTFDVIDGEPVQVVHPTRAIGAAFHDLRHLPEADRDDACERLAADLADEPFDLTAGPLLRAALVWLDAESTIALLVMHHIVTDGWSARLLEEELLLACEALRQNVRADLPAVPIQYGDFAVWQRQQLAATAEERIGWWRRVLDGAPAALSLPLDRARPPVVTFNGATVPFRLPARLHAELAALCQRAGVTGFMATLAAFNFLLAQHCGVNDVVIGTPVAGRTHPTLDRTLGFFVNTIVLRTSVPPQVTFAGLLEGVRDVAMEAYAHQDLPFERLVAELAPDRQLSVTPLFQAMFTYDPAELDEERDDEDDADAVEIDPAAPGTAKFDVTMALAASRDSLTGVLEFNADVFTEASMRVWVQHYHALLEYGVAHPDEPLTAAAMMAAGEREQVVDGWNRTTTDYPRESTIPAIFDEVAGSDPGAPAVVDRGRVVSYAELQSRSVALAAVLAGRGVARGTLVGICADRSIEFVTGILAILRAGGAYVPLDPEYPSDRLRMMVEDTNLTVVLASERRASALRDFPVAVVLLDGAAGADATGGLPPPAGTAGPGDAAYVIFTSGSTGRPKGVVVPHRAVIRLVCETDYIGLGPDDAIGHASNTSFDAATFEIWGALLNGARLVIVGREALLSPRDLGACLRAQGLSVLFITTPLFHQVASADPAAFATLRTLLFGGDVVDPSLVRRVVRSPSAPARLLHVYGPTETTTFATWHLVTDVPDEALTVPIGRPIANTTAYILDTEGRPVPLGVAGELFVGGDGVALGYHGAADATAARFVPDPFSAREGDRLYRTGDLARWLPGGAIEFLGRIDRQVKIRGFRVEPGEVEVTLAQCAGVRQVAVVPHENGIGKYLAAYVSALPAADLSLPVLRQYARERLPDYMVPSHFIVMADLPMTVNGKINRDALPAPHAAPADRPALVVPPRNHVEQVIAEVWRDVLRRDHVSVDDNFFDLGGHSLLLIKVLERLRHALPVELSVLDLFRFPTIATLGAEVGGRNADAVPQQDAIPVLPDAAISERAAQLRRAFSRPLVDGRVPPEAAS